MWVLPCSGFAEWIDFFKGEVSLPRGQQLRGLLGLVHLACVLWVELLGSPWKFTGTSLVLSEDSVVMTPFLLTPFSLGT